jgi:hypothetical protein
MNDEKLEAAEGALRGAMDGMVAAMNEVAFAHGPGFSLVLLKDGEHDDILKRLPKRSALRKRIEHAKMAARYRGEGQGFKTLELTVEATFDE